VQFLFPVLAKANALLDANDKFDIAPRLPEEFSNEFAEKVQF
jgi:hypothetical protein